MTIPLVLTLPVFIDFSSEIFGTVDIFSKTNKHINKSTVQCKRVTVEYDFMGLTYNRKLYIY